MRRHLLPSLETLTLPWFIIPVNNLQNIQSRSSHEIHWYEASSFKTTRGILGTESLSALSLEAGGTRGLLRALLLVLYFTLKNIYKAFTVEKFCNTSEISFACFSATHHEILIRSLFQNDLETFAWTDADSRPQAAGYVFLYLHCRIDKSLDTFIVCAMDYRELLFLEECSTFVYINICWSIYPQTVT